MANKQRRAERKEKNRKLDKDTKESSLKRGKLILENHNNKGLSLESTKELSDRLYNLFLKKKESLSSLDDPNPMYIQYYRLYKLKIQFLILYAHPEFKLPNFKRLFEVYQDDPDNLFSVEL